MSLNVEVNGIKGKTKLRDQDLKTLEDNFDCHLCWYPRAPAPSLSTIQFSSLNIHLNGIYQLNN